MEQRGSCIPINERPQDWWWDTDYAPDGNARNRGPVDDDCRPVIVTSLPGFTRERYLASKRGTSEGLEEFVRFASQLDATDEWYDCEDAPNLYSVKDTIRLSKEDTTREEIDALMARGFLYLGSRGTLCFFFTESPFVQETKHIRFYPTENVRLDLHRAGGCFCSQYHKEPVPGAFDYSRVGIDGIFSRPMPVQREKTVEERTKDEERVVKSLKYREEIKARADAGDQGARFMVALLDIQRETIETANREVLNAILQAKEFQDEYK